MSDLVSLTRRDALKTTLLFSSGLLAGMQPFKVHAADRLKSQVGGEGLHFLTVGDFGTNNGKQRQVADSMVAFADQLGAPLASVLALGDNFYGHLTPDTIHPRFSGYYPKSKLDAPFYAVLGNHDYGPGYDSKQGRAKAEMELAYSVAHPGSRWKMPAKWYAREFGPKEDPMVKIIFLDGNYFEGAMTPQEKIAQRRWLAEELDRPTKARWMWLVSHYPVFSHANPGREGERKHLMKEWKEAFHDPRISLYLAGHDHTLQHLRAEGLKQDFIVSGGGGASRHDVAEAGEDFSMKTRGFNHIHVTRDRVAVNFINAEGDLIHAFERDLLGKMKILPLKS
ncbi:hypothetical protein HNR46_001818 [Haloferula luteola]|uniref:Calcineurin-like phosphoesterase domain-containing protein n=1 Tax=Haloferula luteola TaxID=595692 RepID=A0A840VFK6_9BACT|nr:metallophosphoesterase [Haloferula luteola]MBB5351581.1 hypothetical protein [Haloferula luteola]